LIGIDEVTAGVSYACRFRVETVLDKDNRPANPASPPVSKGFYESLGIIIQRDLANQLVLVKDTRNFQEYVVSFGDIWDIDTIEWVDPDDDDDQQVPGAGSTIPPG